VVANSLASTLPRQKLERRALREHSQALRRVVQFTLLLLNTWIGIQFHLFVRYFETGRPHAIEMEQAH
jgi:hypothetical protein